MSPPVGTLPIPLASRFFGDGFPEHRMYLRSGFGVRGQRLGARVDKGKRARCQGSGVNLRLDR